MNGMTLDEAQDQRYLDLVAVYLYASTALSNTVAASRLYEGLRAAGGLIIDESDEVEGLLSP